MLGPSNEASLSFLRHTVATLAYRAGKTLRGAPEGFADFREGTRTRTPGAILAHMRALFAWALALAAVLALVAVVFVARPVLPEPAPLHDLLDELRPDERRRLDLTGVGDRVVDVPHELGFDHCKGTISGDV